MNKSDGSYIEYRYDTSGNRIKKKVGSDEETYVLDGIGNILGIYKNDTLIEQTITSDARLGSKIASSKPGYRTLGGKMYELSNHLGNVLAVVSDNINMASDSTWASTISISDYYPFGLGMDGRNFQDTTFYRYGFNGMELDNSWKGPGRHYTTEWRQYDPRMGRWMSVDPLMSKMPEWSTYNFGFNNPMRFTDISGLAPDDHYDRDGNFLYRDTRSTDNIRIIDRSDFEAIASKYGSDVMNDRSSSNLELLAELENKSVGINKANISNKAASNIFTDILTREGFDLSNVFNNKISIHSGTYPGKGYNGGVTSYPRENANTAIKGIHSKFPENAPQGTFKISAIFRPEVGSKYLNTVSNVVSILGVHELTGHGVMGLGFGEEDHPKVYDLQRNHPSYKTISPSYKKYLDQ